MNAVSVLIKPASGMCNMACEYCFYADEAKNRMQESFGFMSYETLKNVVRKTMLNAKQSISFAFQGGEPTLRGIAFFEELIRLQEKYNRNQLTIHNALQTNGFAIDEEWCEFLQKHHFLVGLSVDGTEEIHDAYRHDKSGNPTFKRICHTAELFDRYGVEYNILTVVNKKVAEHIDEIYAFYKDSGWNYQQYIPCLEPLKKERGTEKYAITPKEYGDFLIKLFELWYEDYKMGEAPYIRQFENYIGILMGYLPEACDQRGICGIQNVVEADGSVYPCDFYMLDEYCIGNFNQNSFEEIQKNRYNIGFIERSYLLSEECKKCEFFKICKGGCQRNRVLNPQNSLYENYFCESYKQFFSYCLDRMTIIADEEA